MDGRNFLSPEYRKEDVQIGHTYFLVDSKDKLMKRFKYQIVPILKEYYKDGIISFDINFCWRIKGLCCFDFRDDNDCDYDCGSWYDLRKKGSRFIMIRF